jgi:hypothetical protein
VEFCESTDFNVIADRLYITLASFADLLPEPPLYISVQYQTQYEVHVTPQCIDCRILGGSAQRPDFWK